MSKVKLEESENLRRLHIGNFFTDLNQSEYNDLIHIFSNKKDNANQAAFPTELKLSNSADKGLTKREYFAAKAMQGILSNQRLIAILSGNNGMPVADETANYSLQYADELLKQLEQKPTTND